MKRADIEVGKHYTDGKGRIRKITGAGALFRLYNGQIDADCLEYEQWDPLRKRGKILGMRRRIKPTYLGSTRKDSGRLHITRSSFASWAKREATVEEIASCVEAS